MVLEVRSTLCCIHCCSISISALSEVRSRSLSARLGLVHHSISCVSVRPSPSLSGATSAASFSLVRADKVLAQARCGDATRKLRLYRSTIVPLRRASGGASTPSSATLTTLYGSMPQRASWARCIVSTSTRTLPVDSLMTTMPALSIRARSYASRTSTSARNMPA